MPRSPSLLALLALTWLLGAPLRAESPAVGEATAVRAACPQLMTLVDGRFCIDRYEAALERRGARGRWEPARRGLPVGDREVRATPAQSRKPYGHVSARGAERACARAGKRLCSSDEWLAACQGPDANPWPYGDEHIEGRCNDSYPGEHPVLDLFPGERDVWDSDHMTDPRLNLQPNTVDVGGANPGCVSAWGVYDMHGNLHEWVSDPEGVFRGGFFGDARRNGQGCSYRTTAHGPGYRDYSTGFRCCADPSPVPAGDPRSSPSGACGRDSDLRP